MALRNRNDIGTNKTITPEGEQGRVNRVVANRALWNGDFHELMLQSVSREQGSIKINYFRRVVEIYAEFMFNERPVVDFAPMDMMEFVQQAFTDGLRYGEGMIASHPLEPTTFAV